MPAAHAGEHTPKKRVARRSYAERHALLTAARHRYLGVSLRRLCALLAVNRTWYTAHASGPVQQGRDGTVRAAMAQIRQRFPCYGVRRMTHALQRAGWRLNHKRLRRLLDPLPVHRQHHA